LEAFTLQQIDMRARGSAHQAPARFLTLMLAVGAGAKASGLVHVLPTPVLDSRRLALELRPIEWFAGSLAHRHPFERPFKRVLLYWGCTEQASAGQPRVIDAGKVDDQQLSRLLAPRPGFGPYSTISEQAAAGNLSAVAYRNVLMPPGARIEGVHELHAGGDRMEFSVDAAAEFPAPIAITDARVTPSGSAIVRWQGPTGAMAYFATLYAHPGNSPDVIIWTSSRVPEAGYLLSQGHPGAEALLRLRNEGVLMPPEQRQCTVPSAVTRRAAQVLTLQLHALGEETMQPVIAETAPVAVATVRVATRATATIVLPNVDTSLWRSARLARSR